MALGFDPTMTLDELEGVVWGPPTFPSYLMRTCHRLRRVPLSQFTIEDLRILIGQHISLPFLLPIAFERLAAKPFAEGHFYPGDTLVNVLRLPPRILARPPRTPSPPHTDRVGVKRCIGQRQSTGDVGRHAR